MPAVTRAMCCPRSLLSHILLRLARCPLAASSHSERAGFTMCSRSISFCLFLFLLKVSAVLWEAAAQPWHSDAHAGPCVCQQQSPSPVPVLLARVAPAPHRLLGPQRSYSRNQAGWETTHLSHYAFWQQTAHKCSFFPFRAIYWKIIRGL